MPPEEARKDCGICELLAATPPRWLRLSRYNTPFLSVVVNKEVPLMPMAKEIPKSRSLLLSNAALYWVK